MPKDKVTSKQHCTFIPAYFQIIIKTSECKFPSRDTETAPLVVKISVLNIAKALLEGGIWNIFLKGKKRRKKCGSVTQRCNWNKNLNTVTSGITEAQSKTLHLGNFQRILGKFSAFKQRAAKWKECQKKNLKMKKNWAVKEKSLLFLQPREQQKLIDTQLGIANFYFTLTALILHS